MTIKEAELLATEDNLVDSVEISEDGVHIIAKTYVCGDVTLNIGD